MNNTLRSIVNAFRSLFGYPPLLVTRQFGASYTFDDDESLMEQYGFGVEDELASTMADEICKDTDYHIIRMLRLMSGVLPRLNCKYNRTSIYNSKHRYKRSRFNELHGVRFGRFKPGPTRYWKW